MKGLLMLAPIYNETQARESRDLRTKKPMDNNKCSSLMLIRRAAKKYFTK